MNGVTQREWSFLLLLWGLSDPRIAELREMPQSFIIKLYSETQVSGRLGMSGGIFPRHAQNPLSGERRKTLSITHHALSTSHHHLYIIHLINWLQRFYRIIMSLKRPFVPKSDVKQWFTTTTYILSITTNTTVHTFVFIEHFHAICVFPSQGGLGNDIYDPSSKFGQNAHCVMFFYILFNSGSMPTQQTAFVQRLSKIFDVCPTLYKCYTNVLS